MTTLRQAEANRRNSLLSTGPKDTEFSKRNALKHGLAGAGIVVPGEDVQAVADRVRDLARSLQPADPYEHWLIELAARELVRLDRCHHQEMAHRILRARRAELFWDEDRAQRADECAAKLDLNPAVVSRRLRQTPQGCALMIGRWEALGHILEERGVWTEAQRALALDLLGVVPELREAGCTELDAAPGEPSREQCAAVVARELGWLKHWLDTMGVAG
jgi:hypothetical protein